ncbi:hypothetical protein HO133_006928 [Letharia lupina]|uniref:Uncharacterized protein n=1 Tax=Letharia lupina TaxID=560253 RepID=A0A8H6C4G0_9LECA|nr:uncharacterized protein HO133_006928 [Letharia lupina]KAF6217412.1 hypothetical protein HO133_006928 [Letharia lupina]
MAILRIPNISERMRAVELFISSYRGATGSTAATMHNMQDIEREMAMSMTATESETIVVTAADAQTLIQSSKEYGEKYTFQVVLPLVKKHTSNIEFIVAFLTGLFRASEADKLRLEIVQNLFQDILGDVISDLQIQYREVGHEQLLNEYAKRRRFDYNGHVSQAAEDQSPRAMTAEKLASLFHSCEKLGLSREIDQLADKIISHAPNANTVTFEGVLLPLIKQLPPPVERASKIANPHSYTRLFRTVLSSYINTYVQPAPKKPTGLERQPRGCSLYCDDCVKLDAFLNNQQRAQVHFSLNGKRRDHIEERLRQSYCSTETIKRRTPYTLVVKKTGMEWENAMKEWKQRCEVAWKTVEEIGIEKLRGLLGEGWEDVVGLGGIMQDGREESGERCPFGNLAQGKGTSGAVETGANKVAGHVGPEIIDLDCELGGGDPALKGVLTNNTMLLF